MHNIDKMDRFLNFNRLNSSIRAKEVNPTSAKRSSNLEINTIDCKVEIR